MPRNLDRRVEIAFPVLDPSLQAQIREILEIQLADTVKARRIQANPRSARRSASTRRPVRAGSSRSRPDNQGTMGDR